MKLLKYQILVLIDKYHKVTEVAQALNMKQPTISFHMKSMEKEMQTPLFHSARGRILLTEAGRKLLPYARQILSLESAAMQALADHIQLTGNRIRIAAEIIPGSYIVPGLVTEYTKINPKTYISLEIHPADTIKQLLQEEEIDFAFVHDPLLSDSISCHPVFRDHIGIMTSTAHTFSTGAQPTKEELLHEAFAIASSPSFLHSYVKTWFERSSVAMTSVNIVLETASLEALKHAVSAGSMIAFFPQNGIREQEHGLLWHDLPGTRPTSYEIYMMHANHPLSVTVEAFKNFILNQTEQTLRM
ncbi:LysR family transcriptional regulator [Paenibacillus sp. P96]|uniref:LysR family transcriptional regulator n=1 Tax=Paenibacillus zeirhizosphaerae TaxID=2987519 RepID=A0ABT9FT83_9BACL|nr:LysR family transcriptional regulator [Paenibacillus sp. P96]MDP4097884.1 LysR family transcriptional regulator [Paenibacillus sp. P96]